MQFNEVIFCFKVLKIDFFLLLGVMLQRLNGMLRWEWLKLLKRKGKCGLLLGLFVMARLFA
jgi:hypothetical protein